MDASEAVAQKLQLLKIVEKPTPASLAAAAAVPVANVVPEVENVSESEISSPPPPPPPDIPKTDQTSMDFEPVKSVEAGVSQEPPLPTVLIMVGMAGSGKTTLTSQMISYLLHTGTPPYVVNLDPACLDPPYGVNIDIRDTINYKHVMKANRLGPNGAIVTSLNLFATKFDAVLDILKQRATTHRYIIIDTPGQIEVFMWSASGSIITELLAAHFPTVMVYVSDLLVTKSPISFMSNMTYACSILYKTKLPLIIALNKCDVESADTVKTWIKDLNAYQEALRDQKDYSANLASSLSLVLDEFYENIQHTAVSALTGEGIPEFFKSLEAAVIEYNTVYRVNYQKQIERRKRKLAMPHHGAGGEGGSKKSADEDVSTSFAFSLPASSDGGLGLNLTLDEDFDNEPESEEEGPSDAVDEDETNLQEATIRQVYKRETDRRTKLVNELNENR